MTSDFFLKQAIEKSRQSVDKGGFPAGAVLVKNDEVIATGTSIGNILHDPTSHGEVATIREACKALGTTDLSGTTLYTSLEPCSMCLSAAMWASISKIVFACRKEEVPQWFYGGTYETNSINEKFTKPLEVIHEQSNQAEAIKVIKEWEKSHENTN